MKGPMPVVRWTLALVLAGFLSVLHADTLPGKLHALGLHLPKDALSLWRVQEKTAWGLEISGDWYRSQGDALRGRLDANDKFVDGEVVDSDSRTFLVHAGLLHQRFRVTFHDVKPFLFSGARGSIRSGDHDGRLSFRRWSLEATLGVGAAWQPFDRVGLWVRRGFSIGYTFQNRPYLGEDVESSSLGFGTDGPEVIAFFTF